MYTYYELYNYKSNFLILIVHLEKYSDKNLKCYKVAAKAVMTILLYEILVYD